MKFGIAMLLIGLICSVGPLLLSTIEPMHATIVVRGAIVGVGLMLLGLYLVVRAKRLAGG